MLALLARGGRFSGWLRYSFATSSSQLYLLFVIVLDVVVSGLVALLAVQAADACGHFSRLAGKRVLAS